MPTIQLSTYIASSPELVFDLSRNISLHVQSMEHTGEKAIAGVTEGLINLNETVTWQARHFFKNRILQTKITAMKLFTSFTDEMVKGDFKSMKHVHNFEAKNCGTLMTDIFSFSSPFGIFGRVVNFLFLTRYLKILLQKRNKCIKDYAETGKWKTLN